MGLGSCLRILLTRIIAGLFPSKKSRVILYHDICNYKSYTDMATSVELFKQHISIIRSEGFEIVPDITNNTGQIQITFDDAFLGLYDNLSVIKELNIPIKLFVITSFLNKEKYINMQQLKEIASCKWISIGSHTHTHNRLSDLSNNKIKHELGYSKKILEELLNCKITDLCYPEGKFDKRVVDIANDMGYSKQYSLIPGLYQDEIFLNVKRRSLVQYAKKKYFIALLYGGNDFLSTWYMKKHFKK